MAVLEQLVATAMVIVPYSTARGTAAHIQTSIANFVAVRPDGLRASAGHVGLQGGGHFEGEIVLWRAGGIVAIG